MLYNQFIKIKHKGGHCPTFQCSGPPEAINMSMGRLILDNYEPGIINYRVGRPANGIENR